MVISPKVNDMLHLRRKIKTNAEMLEYRKKLGLKQQYNHINLQQWYNHWDRSLKQQYNHINLQQWYNHWDRNEIVPLKA